jgi:hypothetical protein
VLDVTVWIWGASFRRRFNPHRFIPALGFDSS